MLKYLEFAFNHNEMEAELRAVAYIYFHEIAKAKLDLPRQVKVHIVKFQKEKFETTPLHLSRTLVIVYCKCDVSNYFQLSRKEKIHLQTEIIHDSLQFLFDKLQVDFAPIQHLKDKINSSDLNLDLDLRLIKSKKKVDYEASVIVKPDFDCFNFYLKVKTKTEELEYLLFKGHTAFLFSYHSLFHSILCETGIVTVRSKRKEIAFKCNLSTTDVCEIIYKDPDYKKALDSKRCSTNFDFYNALPIGF